MKVDFGRGLYIEPDQEPRNTVWHKRIVKERPLPCTRKGHVVDLECGHRAEVFGDLARCNGVILCMECRDHKGVG